MTPEEALAEALKARGFTFLSVEWAPEDAPIAEALAVPCPLCGAAAGVPCGALGRVHSARLPVPKRARSGGRCRSGTPVTASVRHSLKRETEPYKPVFGAVI